MSNTPIPINRIIDKLDNTIDLVRAAYAAVSGVRTSDLYDDNTMIGVGRLLDVIEGDLVEIDGDLTALMQSKREAA